MAADAAFIKELARNQGFLDCGISSAGLLADEAPKLEQWLKEGKHASMKWMENHFEKRLDPTKLVPGAKSVISVLQNYFPAKTQKEGLPKIAKYAYGTDYHFVMKDKLNLMLQQMREKYGEVEGRVFVDSAPVMERAWAARSGLGWIGKHSLLLNKKAGSFFFIGQIICDLELEADLPTADHCGTCTACIDACPTEAIVANRVVDAGRCISYLTIEHKGDIPVQFKDKMEDWAFGCDICQDVCPWNRFSSPHAEPNFEAKNEVLTFDADDWREISGSAFNKRFKSSPLSRPGHKGFMRNLDFISDSDDASK